MAEETIFSAARLPAKDALAYFRQKDNVPTEHWTDLWQEGHAKGFMIAGAAADGLLRDLRGGVEKAFTQGMTMGEWRKEFPDIADRYGWKYNGSPGRRADIIYDTNMTTALSAGRYRRMVTPEAMELYPFWRYTHHACLHPRVQHVAWDGTILPANDPWFNTHFPPNGWRCHCTVEMVSRAKMKRMKWEVSERPPYETRPWINPRNGTVHQVPVGIDPGFAYNPGRAWMENEGRRAGHISSDRFPAAEDAGPAHSTSTSSSATPSRKDASPMSHPMAPPIASAPDAAHPAALTADQQRQIHIKAIRQQHETAVRSGVVPSGDVVVGKLPPDLQNLLGAKISEVRFSDDGLRKQLGLRAETDPGDRSKGHPELTTDQYALLPDILSDPSIVAVQGDTRIALMQKNGHWYRAVVKVTRDKEKLYLVSFHEMTIAKAIRSLRGLSIVKGSEDLLEESDAPKGPAGNPL